MNNDNYSGGLTREQFLFEETRITARLMDQGLEDKEIVDMIQADNLFQYPTEKMLRSKALSCLRRLKALDNKHLVYHIAHGSGSLARQINLYAVMRENAIVWDFFVYTIGDKYKAQDLNFTQRDINAFISELMERIPKCSQWSESTEKKIKQVLKKMLVECGFLRDIKSERLEQIYLYPELEDGIVANGDSIVLAAFNSIR